MYLRVNEYGDGELFDLIKDGQVIRTGRLEVEDIGLTVGTSITAQVHFKADKNPAAINSLTSKGSGGTE
jgi:hypothetical protein